MNLVVFHNQDMHSKNEGAEILPFLLNDPLLAGMIAAEYREQGFRTTDRSHRRGVRVDDQDLASLGRVCWAVPRLDEWEPKLTECIFTNGGTSLPLGALEHVCDDPWLIISNGRYIGRINPDMLAPLLQQEKAQVIGLSFDGRLRGFREQLRMARDRKVVGFQRYYDDSCVPMPLSEDWPHRVFIRRSLLRRWETLPLSYQALLQACRDAEAIVKEYHVGDNPVDLMEAAGVLRWFLEMHDTVNIQAWKERLGEDYTYVHDVGGTDRSSRLRCHGHAWIGRDVNIHPSATLIGPVVIGDRVSIGEQTLVDTAILGPDVDVAARAYVANTIVTDRRQPILIDSRENTTGSVPVSKVDRFKHWPAGSYVRFIKRILDIIFAANLLVLLLPVMPVIALAIKLNSPGPVFYRARRQGLHGKEFNCLKFRTMKVGADQLQAKLRNINEVDGPQFKMADDPRISTVGRFLRETYLDEIPQFVNVLLGQMSVVGPRPSPKNENTHCPRWRDARLSVRPGVTGLWQLLRTREPTKDFQEWIHYDIEYVRRVSLRLDVWICWKSALLMLSKFIQQF